MVVYCVSCLVFLLTLSAELRLRGGKNLERDRLGFNTRKGSYVGTPTPNVTVFADMALTGVIKVK